MTSSNNAVRNTSAKTSAEIAELKATLRWISTALPVLETMCGVAKLTGGQRKAREMIDYLKDHHGISAQRRKSI